jgi:Mrp family chromosome partitioning ATPase
VQDLPSACRERLTLSSEADPLLGHQFRRLVATLLQAQGNGELKKVMITSAAPGDGKTLTALNLAFVLSESYHSGAHRSARRSVFGRSTGG